MLDFTLEPDVTLIAGRQGCGKSSFVYRYLVNADTEQPCNPEPTVCTFIFDWKLEASQRLGIAPCGTVAQCEAAIQTRWVVFNPFVMFAPMEGKEPADVRAFRWFCKWIYEVAQRGPGRKILVADELAQYVPSRSDRLTEEFETLLRQGRAANLALVTATQFASDYAKMIRKSVTEWVCFNLDDESDLDAVRTYYRGVDKVKGMPRGSFIAYNRESGAELRGKLF